MNFSILDRRSFLHGTGVALALPWFESFAADLPSVSTPRKRLACFYVPDGVPMPRREDPAFEDWSWFPHTDGDDYRFTKCLEPLETLRKEITVFSGLSHPAVRNVHGHSNADQFLTGADTGGRGDYENSISMDQVFAAQIGGQTRHESLVMSTDGGTGSPRGIQTMSFNRQGRPIPAENRPKRVFDQLFVTSSQQAARQLAAELSALDPLLEDARSLKRRLSQNDQETLEQYLQSVRETEQKLEKAKEWLNVPLPTVNADHLNLEITPEDPRNYLRTMFELVFLAFHADMTRTVTYQIGRENGVGISDGLARAVGHNLTHMLSHWVKKPGGWENFGTYHRFLCDEFGRFLTRLKSTPEPGGHGSMLDNTLCLYGSASSAFHMSQNYPLILAGGERMGIRQGQYLRYGTVDQEAISGFASDSVWKADMKHEEEPTGRLLLTMLQQLGVEIKEFAGCSQVLPEMLV
ncbi:DUF1552 domain-containing protein [Aureliella helgolandensis]|uniref:DUF1552 domain-containing protein n=1 Tax=Aureliella helgolandensis TaxID=2527968 RepID=A0A518G450_9BACT|nr:DUF1552 domain-containing protein [Aureliella helgolandensis]QDV23374.1 hypothetical protein Q31a_16720 [Aureliella helgolandensis]